MTPDPDQSPAPAHAPAPGPVPGPEDRTAFMVQLWDTLADTYDQVGVDFFRPAASGLVDALDPQPGERAIDFGCGLGAVLLPLARRVGPTGRALGADLSPRMVTACAGRAESEGLSHVAFRVVDAQQPGVDELLEALGGPADLLASSLVVFFLADPAAALARWVPLLRPGGRVGLTTFGDRDTAWSHLDAVFDPFLPPQLQDARTTGARGISRRTPASMGCSPERVSRMRTPSPVG